MRSWRERAGGYGAGRGKRSCADESRVAAQTRAVAFADRRHIDAVGGFRGAGYEVIYAGQALGDYRLDPPDDDAPTISKRQAQREESAVKYMQTRVQDGKRMMEIANSMYMGVPDETDACEDMETIWGICRKYWGKAIR